MHRTMTVFAVGVLLVFGALLPSLEGQEQVLQAPHSMLLAIPGKWNIPTGRATKAARSR